MYMMVVHSGKTIRCTQLLTCSSLTNMRGSRSYSPAGGAYLHSTSISKAQYSTMRLYTLHKAAMKLTRTSS